MRRISIGLIKKLGKFLGLILLFLPVNLFLSLSEKLAFLNGLRVDYLIPKLYLSQLFVWFGVVFSLIYQPNHSFANFRNWFKNKSQLILAIGIGIIIFRQLFVGFPTVALWFFTQTISSLAFLWLLGKYKKVMTAKEFSWLVLLSLIIQAMLAVFQFTQQRPLFPYYILGEPRFEPYFMIARQLFDGKEKILAYGSTAYPNVLAGVAVIFCLILLKRTLAKQQLATWLCLILALLATCTVLFTTQSVSALLTLLIGSSLLIFNSTKKTLNKIGVPVLLVSLLLIIAATPLIIHQLEVSKKVS